MATEQESIKHLVEFITLQVNDDKYIDRKEEKNIIEEGIKHGIGVDRCLAIIQKVAHEYGYAVEREIEERAKTLLEQFANNDGKIDRREFDDAFALFKKESKGGVNDNDIRRCLKQIILDQGWVVKEGGLFGSKWFSAIN